MPDNRNPTPPLDPRLEDELRAFHRSLESQAQPDEAFKEQLYRRLERSRLSRNRGWWRIGFGSPGSGVLMQVAVVAVVVVAAVGTGVILSGVLRLSRPVASGPSATPFAVASPSSETPIPSESGSATPTPQPSATPIPTPTYAVAGVWERRADLPNVSTPRISDAVVGRNGRIYVFPEGDASSPVLVYDPIGDDWSTLQPTVLPPYGTGTDSRFALAPDGRFYRFAPGAEYTEVHAYDPTTNRWQAAAVGRITGFYSTAVVAGQDGLLYALGGNGSGGSVIYAFDPTTGHATLRGTSSDSYTSLFAASDGTLLVVGDTGVGRFSPVTDGWTRIGPAAPTSLFAAGVGLGPDGRLYAFGGPSSGGVVQGVAISFDPVTRQWGSVRPPTVARSTPRLIAAAGRLYLIGGNPGQTTLERTVEAFTPR